MRRHLVIDRRGTVVRFNRLTGLLVAGVCVVATACGSSGGSDTGGTSGTEKLAGTAWDLTAMTPPVAGLSDVTVSARFEGGRISGHSGCNTYRASYTQSGDSLTVGKDIASTKIACPSALSAVERAYLARLPRVRSFSRSGSTLTLEDADGKALLTYTTAPSGAEAIAGDWNVTSFFTGTAISSPTGSQPLTAKFAADTASGNSGCNSFNGPAKVDGTSIAIGPLASTLMACADPAVDQQAQQYTAALELAKTFEVVGDRLSLYRADGGYAAIFERG
jgi:heat shock protein HslJ